jgi:hypothetical protein
MKRTILFLVFCFLLYTCIPPRKEYFGSLREYSDAVCRVQDHFKPNQVLGVDIVSPNTLHVHVFDPVHLVSTVHRVTLGKDIQVTRVVMDVPRKTIKHHTFFT